MSFFNKELDIIGKNQYYKINSLIEDEDTNDLSFFTIDEWNHLVQMDEVFEKYKKRLDEKGEEISHGKRMAANAFYYLGFSDGIKKDIYPDLIYGREIFESVYDTGQYTKISVNVFRDKIVKKYKEIHMNYEFLIKN